MLNPSEWTLAWKIARRELRTGARGFVVFLLCLALGTGAIVSVGTVSRSMLAGLDAEGKNLLGGDVSLRLHDRSFRAQEKQWLASNTVQISEILNMRAMARPAEQKEKRHLVELKAVDQNYPLSGQVKTDQSQPLGVLLAQENGVWGAVADQALFRQLNLKVGDKIRVGDGFFELRAKMVKEPDRVASILSFGPRLMVSDGALEQTGLVQPGSQIHYSLRATLEQEEVFEVWKEGLEAQYPDAAWRIRGISESAPGVRRFIDRMSIFLTFVGLSVLLVGGVGVANGVASFLDGKSNTIATFKCLGAPANLVFLTYMQQVMVMAVIGTGAGLVLGSSLSIAGMIAVSSLLPVQPIVGLYAEPIVIAAAFGLLVAFTFGIWPVARARDVPAVQLFRGDASISMARPRRVYILAMAFGGLALAALVFVTANNTGFAVWFLVGTALSLSVLRASAGGVMSLCARLKPNAAWVRLSLANIHRPHAATLPVTLSLGLGLAVLVAVSLIQQNLGFQISKRLPEAAPAFFFIDIQPDQIEGFSHAVQSIEGTKNYRQVPSLRGRITEINGIPVEEADVAPDAQWAIRGDRALTFSGPEPEGSDIVEGNWWPENYSGKPRLSLDASLAKGFGVAIGDSLTVNVLSREITAEITNLRKIDWRSLRFDFALIFAPGVLEGAPFTHIAAIEAPASIEDEVEQAATNVHSNITAIRVREALESAGKILSGIDVAISSMAALSIVSGLIVLAGAIAAGHRRRIYDAVVFKVLGASRKRIASVFLLEFAIIGLATGVIATVIGTITSWAVIKFLMKMDWQFFPFEAGLTVALTLLVTVLLGGLSIWNNLSRKPMPYLRND